MSAGHSQVHNAGIDLRLRELTASAAPAIMWAAIGCPFDVIKTRLQTATTSFSSPLHCLVWTLRREGGRALWKGFVPQLLISTPYSMIMFGVYQSLKPCQTRVSVEGSGYIAGCFIAGAASGVVVTVVHSPLELWRVRVQTHLSQHSSKAGHHQHGTTAGVLRSLLKNPWQLGRGSSMVLLENVVGNGVFFGSNEVMRQHLLGSDNLVNLGFSTEALVGGLTGVIFQLVIYPADLIKARLMAWKGVQAREVFSQILIKDGIRGMYRGASVTILRAFVINAAGWPALRATQASLGLV